MTNRQKILAAILAFGSVFLLRVMVYDIRMQKDWQMFPNLYVGDFVLLDKLERSFAVGDLVWLEAKQDRPQGFYRIVAQEGQSVAYIGGRLYIDGQLLSKELSEPFSFFEEQVGELVREDFEYLRYRMEPALGEYKVVAFEMGSRQNYWETKVPKQSFFLLKDFRAIGRDSRHFGFVLNSEIDARASLILYSCQPWSFLSLPLCNSFEPRLERFFLRIL